MPRLAKQFARNAQQCPRPFKAISYQEHTDKQLSARPHFSHSISLQGIERPKILSAISAILKRSKVLIQHKSRIPVREALGCWIFIARLCVSLSLSFQIQCKQKKLTKNWLSCATINQSTADLALAICNCKDVRRTGAKFALRNVAIGEMKSRWWKCKWKWWWKDLANSFRNTNRAWVDCLSNGRRWVT